MGPNLASWDAVYTAMVEMNKLKLGLPWDPAAYVFILALFIIAKYGTSEAIHQLITR